jgi:hypothetical protein
MQGSESARILRLLACEAVVIYRHYTQNTKAGGIFFWNISNFLPVYAELRPRKQ